MFDFGNVIGMFDTLSFHEFIKKHRRNCVDPDELFSGSLHWLIGDYDSGKIDSFHYFQAVQKAFRLADITMDEFFEKVNHVVHIDEKMLEIIDKLRNRGVATILITNMNPSLITYLRLNKAGILSRFDYLFISCEEKIAKPDSEAWIRPLDAMGLKAEECLFIDDYLGNIQAALSLGIKSFNYNVTGKHYYPNGKLEEERKRLNDFLDMLWGQGILKPYR